MSCSQPAPRHPKLCANIDNVTWHPVGKLTNCLGISGDEMLRDGFGAGEATSESTAAVGLWLPLPSVWDLAAVGWAPGPAWVCAAWPRGGTNTPRGLGVTAGCSHLTAMMLA